MDFFALIDVGMWLGMRCRGTTRATLGALARINCLRWVVFVFSMFLFAMGRLLDGGSGTEYFVLFYWGGVAIGLDIFFMTRARSNLVTHFRGIATRQFEIKRLPVTTVAPPPVPTTSS
jgi:hypothetical protein